MRLLRIVIRSLFTSRPAETRLRTRAATPSQQVLQERTGGDAAPPVKGHATAAAIAWACACPQEEVRTIRGRCWVIDGDTIVIEKVHIRLAGIDAPELDHPWGRNARSAMIELCKGQVISARLLPESTHDRAVAICHLPDGRDLAAELVRMGLALAWPRFSGGRYRHLEPKGIRKKLWRADAKQKGRYDARRHG